MKYVFYIFIVVGLVVSGAMKWNSHVQKERALAYQRQMAAQEEESRKIKEEEKKAEEEREKVAEVAAKEKAIKLFNAFFNQQEKILKDTVEESTVQNELIAEDMKQLSAALRTVEQETLRRAEEARKRKEKRYDRAETVLLLLRNATINRLAQTYLGEDFSAERADFQSKVSTMIEMQKKERSRLDANRRKYEEAVAGINEDVDKKNAYARNKLEAANRGLDGRLSQLYKDRARVQERIRVLKHELKGPRVRKDMELAEQDLERINSEISNMEQVTALGKANTAHLSATLIETSARKRYDTALATRQDDDNAVHADMRHEGDVFAVSVAFEARTCDRLRAAMKARQDMLALRANDAQKKLDIIRDSTANIDLMSAKEVDDLRKKISDQISTKITKILE